MNYVTWCWIGLNGRSLSVNRQNKVRFSWTVELEAVGVEKEAAGTGRLLTFHLRRIEERVCRLPFGQQVCQDAVDRGVRLVENERQLRRVDERRPAEGVEQLSV